MSTRVKQRRRPRTDPNSKCVLCQSTQTRIGREGYPKWYRHRDSSKLLICDRCYKADYRAEHAAELSRQQLVRYYNRRLAILERRKQLDAKNEKRRLQRLAAKQKKKVISA